MKRFFQLLALFATLFVAGCNRGSRPAHIGDVARDFTLQDSDRQITLNQFRGQVVVLNFWATWCPPCVEELPSLIAMQERTKVNGVVVVGISIDVDGDAYHRFLKLRNINFLLWIANLYGTAGWPETYVIDRQGVMRRKFVGPVDWNSPEVMQFLSQL